MNDVFTDEKSGSTGAIAGVDGGRRLCGVTVGAGARVQDWPPGPLGPAAGGAPLAARRGAFVPEEPQVLANWLEVGPHLPRFGAAAARHVREQQRRWAELPDPDAPQCSHRQAATTVA